MEFFKTKVNESNSNGNRYAVYMQHERYTYYVCDMIDDDTEKSADINELGLTLRARLTRSKGKYAMLEGVIFNPERLLQSACEITDYSTEEFKGGEYKSGYTLLTVTTDNCINKYLIFNEVLLQNLLRSIKYRINQNKEGQS